jgi:hypothetical protein
MSNNVKHAYILSISYFKNPDTNQRRDNPKNLLNIIIENSEIKIYVLYFSFIDIFPGKKKVKVKLSRYTPWWHLGGEEV